MTDDEFPTDLFRRVNAAWLADGVVRDRRKTREAFIVDQCDLALEMDWRDVPLLIHDPLDREGNIEVAVRGYQVARISIVAWIMSVPSPTPPHLTDTVTPQERPDANPGQCGRT